MSPMARILGIKPLRQLDVGARADGANPTVDNMLRVDYMQYNGRRVARHTIINNMLHDSHC